MVPKRLLQILLVAPIPLPTHGATDSTPEVVASAPTDEGSVEPPQHKQERQRTVKFAEPLCSAHSPMPDVSTPKFETPAKDAEVAHTRSTVTFAEPLCSGIILNTYTSVGRFWIIPKNIVELRSISNIVY